jgi:hypothetical protein
MTARKQLPWHQLSREQQIARVMYPHLCEPEYQKEMGEIAKANGKRPPQGPSLIKDGPGWPEQLKKGKT